MIQTIQIQQETFAYLSWGEPADKLVLCLHGFPDTPHSFSLYAKEMSLRGYYVVAPFLRGYAPSPLRGSMSVEQLSWDVYQFARAFSPDKPVFLVAHDWGAAIGYVALSEYPDTFSKAVMMSVPHPIAFLKSWLMSPAQLKKSWYMFLFQLGPLADAMIKRNNFALIEKLWRDWSPGYAPTSTQWSLLKDCLRQSMPYPVDYYRNMFWPPRQALVRLQEAKPVKKPVLYLHGSRDGCISYEARRGQEKYIVGGLQEVLLDGVGHFIPLEAPERLMQESLRWFIEK